jgi:Methyltransferase domain
MAAAAAVAFAAMDLVTDDTATRQEELERWAEEQRRRLKSGTRLARLQTRLVLKRRLLGHRLAVRSRSADRMLDRLADRLLGRGLETSGEVRLPEHERDGRVRYVPSAWHVLPRALRDVEISERDTFVDFGCGKGRVVHQAALRPFGRVIGVEVSPRLAEMARSALAARSHQHRCRNVEIVISDVRRFQVPDDMTIGYLFQPFGDETLASLLRGIVESIDRQPRLVRLIYLWPTSSARSMILATDRFRLVKEQSSSLINPRAERIAIFESR